MLERNKRINLWDIVMNLQRRIKWILLVTGICGVVTWFANAVIVSPQYETSVSLYVYSSMDRTGQSASTITLSEIDASQSLVDTYIVILKSNTVLNQVIEKLELNMTASQLGEKISAASVNGTEVLSVSVTDKDPKMAQKIANTIARILPNELVRVVKAGGVEVVDYAELPKQPSSPNVLINTLAGFLVGLFLSCGVFLVYDFSNRKICGEEDLTSNFDISVIGVIPKLNIAEEDQDEDSNKER